MSDVPNTTPEQRSRRKPGTRLLLTVDDKQLKSLHAYCLSQGIQIDELAKRAFGMFLSASPLERLWPSIARSADKTVYDL